MAIKKYLIHCLLVFCIALQPALSAVAINPEHSASAPMHCFDYDPAGKSAGDACKSMDCNSVTHSCGSQAGANYLPTSSLLGDTPLARINDPDPNDPDYRQTITDPIYRPPIA